MIIIGLPLWLIFGIFIFLGIKAILQIRDEKEEEEQSDFYWNRFIEAQENQ